MPPNSQASRHIFDSVLGVKEWLRRVISHTSILVFDVFLHWFYMVFKELRTAGCLAVVFQMFVFQLFVFCMV